MNLKEVLLVMIFSSTSQTENESSSREFKNDLIRYNCRLGLSFQFNRIESFTQSMILLRKTNHKICNGRFLICSLTSAIPNSIQGVLSFISLLLLFDNSF